jgi:hypothetical protein
LEESLRKLLLIGALGILATPVTAQRLWQPEIGMQGGFSSFRPAGTGASSTTLIELPGGSFLTTILSYAPLYAVIPVGNRLAVEPQLGASQVTLGGNAITIARVGLRLNFGFGPGLYGAAGTVLNIVEPGSPGNKQVGLQVGVGYRTHLAGSLNGRVEANWVTTHASDVAGAFNTYSVLLGVSSTLGARPATRSTRAGTEKAWSPELGVGGGYGSAHAVGSGGDITGIFLPGGLNSFTSFGAVVPSPATLFAILPLSGKWAIEPSFDLHRFAPPAPASRTTSFEAGVRADYAIAGGWYAAAGAQLTNVNRSTGSSATMAGASLAGGYRFHLAGPTGGRVEVNYLMTAKNNTLGNPPINTLSFLFGLTMPLR